MKKLFVSLSLVLLFATQVFAVHPIYWPPADSFPVKEIFQTVPIDLKENTLLIAQFDEVKDSKRFSDRQLADINRSVNTGNGNITKVLKKSYPYEYKMISLRNMKDYLDEGYLYYLDVVIMPKQMQYPRNPKALVATYKAHPSANRMYVNRNLQFHYYFYIRDIQTDDIYITRKFRGDYDVYDAMKAFLKQVVKESEK